MDNRQIKFNNEMIEIIYNIKKKRMNSNSNLLWYIIKPNNLVLKQD